MKLDGLSKKHIDILESLSSTYAKVEIEPGALLCFLEPDKFCVDSCVIDLDIGYPVIPYIPSEEELEIVIRGNPFMFIGWAAFNKWKEFHYAANSLTSTVERVYRTCFDEQVAMIGMIILFGEKLLFITDGAVYNEYQLAEKLNHIDFLNYVLPAVRKFTP